MKYELYAVKDELTGFTTPQTEINEQTAMRNFKYAFSKKDTINYANINDYSLWFMGTLDLDNGVIDSTDCPKKICNASAFKETLDV